MIVGRQSDLVSGFVVDAFGAAISRSAQPVAVAAA